MKPNNRHIIRFVSLLKKKNQGGKKKMEKKYFAAGRVSFFFVTRISGNKTIFFFGLVKFTHISVIRITDTNFNKF